MSAIPHSSSRNAVGEFLVACARVHLDPAFQEQLKQRVPATADQWDATLKIAEEHGIIPLMYRAIESSRISEVPDALRRKLRERAHQYTSRNMLLVQQLIRILNAMSAQGVRAIPYKGPTLAMFAYGDLSLRQPGDLDILVPKEDLAPARAVLEVAGFRLSVPMNSHTEAKHLASPHEYDYCYIRDEGALAVELHWQVIGKLFSFSPNPVDLWERSTERHLAGTTIRTFSPEDNLLVLCAHGMKHFWSRLSWIFDLAAHIKSSPQLDWQKLMKRASSLDARGMTLLGLVLANRVVGAAVPDTVLSKASGSIRAQAAELHERLFLESNDPEGLGRGLRAQLVEGGLLQSLIFHFRTRESWSSGLRYCFHRAFTPNVVDQGWMRLPAPLRFLYYPLRPLRLLAKYGPLKFLFSAGRSASSIPSKL